MKRLATVKKHCGFSAVDRNRLLKKRCNQMQVRYCSVKFIAQPNKYQLYVSQALNKGFSYPRDCSANKNRIVVRIRITDFLTSVAAVNCCSTFQKSLFLVLQPSVHNAINEIYLYLHTFDARLEKTDLKVFVVVIPPSLGMTLTIKDTQLLK